MDDAKDMQVVSPSCRVSVGDAHYLHTAGQGETVVSVL